MASREGNVLVVPSSARGEQYLPIEIMASMVGLYQKGRTLKAGQGILEAGTILDRDSGTGKYIRTVAGSAAVGVLRHSVDTGGADINEVQAFGAIGGISGTFTISYAGQTTAAIAYNANAAAVDAALELLVNIGTGGVAVTGGPANTTAFAATFAGGGPREALVVNVGSAPSAVASQSFTTRGYKAETSSDKLGNIVLAGILKRAPLVAANGETFTAAAVTALNGRSDIGNTTDPNSYVVIF